LDTYKYVEISPEWVLFKLIIKQCSSSTDTYRHLFSGPEYPHIRHLEIIQDMKNNQLPSGTLYRFPNLVSLCLHNTHRYHDAYGKILYDSISKVKSVTFINYVPANIRDLQEENEKRKSDNKPVITVVTKE